MSTFSDDPASFATHTAYVGLLKTAVKKVRTEPRSKFLYYKSYKFGSNTKPLVLFDHDANCQTVLASKGLKPTATGLVSLTEQDELDFQVKQGKLNRIQLKKYFESMPGTMKAVFVAADDVEEDEDESEDGGDALAKPTQAKPKPLPKPPSQAGTQAKPTTQPSAVQPQTQSAKPKPLPAIPPELIRRIKDLEQTELLPEWELKKEETLKTALTLLKGGEHGNAERVLDALAAKSLARASAKPLPTPPTGANVAAVQQVKAEILADLEESESEGDDLGEDEGDDSGEAAVLDSPAAKKAALSPAASVAGAQQRLAEEEEAFKHRKTVRKAEKIKASASQQEKAKQEQEAKEAKKAQKAKAKEEAGEKGLLDFLSFKKEAKNDAGPKAEKNRIDQTLDRKTTDDRIKKFGDKPLQALGLAGTAEKGLATGIGKVLDAGNTGDDIASAAGAIATSTAGAAKSLMHAVREFQLWKKTHGAESSVHLKKAMEALGATVGNLVNLTKGSLTVAEHSGALEAGSAVPILGIVAAVPTLLSEINQLRSAMNRLYKQQKIRGELEERVKAGDNSQATLHAMVSGFIARDGEAIGKNIAKVTLDFTKIAGHGVSAGGITGPIGVALVSVAAAGKLVISGIDTAEELIDANKANDRRKKLQPTLKAPGEWKDLRKEKPDARENVEMTAALQALVKAEKGTKAHADALEQVATCAEAVKRANTGQKQVVDFATQLAVLAKQEKESWQESDEDEDEQAQGSGAEDPHQRNARKLIKRDPQIAAQVLLDQAQREGPPGGPAFKVLASFGIKAKQVYSDAQGDEKIAMNREMRQKILYKLGADDETAQTLSQKLGGAKDGVKDYFSMRDKHQELTDYMAAKNLLQHGGEKKRGKGWRLKMDILTDDVEEKKEVLLAQVDFLLQNKDIDEKVANEARALLRPRKEKAKTA